MKSTIISTGYQNKTVLVMKLAGLTQKTMRTKINWSQFKPLSLSCTHGSSFRSKNSGCSKQTIDCSSKTSFSNCTLYTCTLQLSNCSLKRVVTSSCIHVSWPKNSWYQPNQKIKCTVKTSFSPVHSYITIFILLAKKEFFISEY